MNEADKLEFRHISKSFPGVKALDDISLKVRAGKVHVICGENGAGKSTLVKILNGIYAPDSGEILIDGVPVKIKSPIDAQAQGIFIRNTVCYPRLNVKIVGTHAGLTVGEDGATHQCLEDLALMRSIPGMTVICPADGEETRQAVRAVSEYAGPVYLRLGRLAVAPVSDFEGYRFEIGRAVTLRGGNDVTIAATGIMVQEALRAADALGAEGIRARVVNIHTVKPLDEKTILDAARETGAIVTAEEHNVLGGLGGAVAEVVAERFPVPVVRVGARDTFGRSGDALQLMQAYGLTAEEIVRQCKVALALKG